MGIKDPSARRFFRFGEAEHAIAQQFDGRTALADVPVRQETVIASVGFPADRSNLAFACHPGRGIVTPGEDPGPSRNG